MRRQGLEAEREELPVCPNEASRATCLRERHRIEWTKKQLSTLKSVRIFVSTISWVR